MGTHEVAVVRSRVHPALAGLVAGAVGMSEHATSPVLRRQPAGTLVPLVVSWGDPLEVVSLSTGAGADTYGSFVAGLMPGHASTRFDRSQQCLQMYLTPLGVQRILGVPGSEVASRVVGLADVAPGLTHLPDRLASAGSWHERFTLAYDALLHLAARGREPDDVVAWAWHEIALSGGQVRVGDLVRRSGWSHRHLTSRFAEQVGLTPKAVAGIVRFERAYGDLGRRPLAEVAARHGYADQSHLSREVLRLAGATPAALAAAPAPTAYSALGVEPHGPPAGDAAPD